MHPLVIVPKAYLVSRNGQVDQTEPALSQNSLDAVAVDAHGTTRLLGCGGFQRRRGRLYWLRTAALHLLTGFVGFAGVVRHESVVFRRVWEYV